MNKEEKGRVWRRIPDRRRSPRVHLPL